MSQTRRTNPFEEANNGGISDMSQIKEWVSLKLKELESQNQHLQEENRKFTEELFKLKERYVKKSFTPETRRKYVKRSGHSKTRSTSRSKKDYHSYQLDSSSSDDEYYVPKLKYNKQRSLETEEKSTQPKIEGNSITLLSGASRQLYTHKSGSLDRRLNNLKKLNFGSLKKDHYDANLYDVISSPANSKLIDFGKEDCHKPPTPPLHRCPSWESRIYEIANNGIMSTIATPVQQEKSFKCIPTEHHDDYNLNVDEMPIFKNINGHLTKITVNSCQDDSISSDLDGERSFPRYFKSSTTSSGNESDYTNEFRPSADIESDSSQDYAFPPDAFQSSIDSLKNCDDVLSTSKTSQSELFCINETKLEKSGYLLKLSGRFKTWKRRWFVLKDGTLSYFKNQSDSMKKKPKGQIILDQTCKLIRAKDCKFHLSYKDGKKIMHLSADSNISYSKWIRVISQTLTFNNIFKLQDNQVPVIENYLIKVRFGHSIKCWVALYGHYLVYFNNSQDKIPLGYTNLKDSKLKEMDSLTEIEDIAFIYDDLSKNVNHSISIHANDNDEPIYLLFLSKSDFSLWYYHLKIASNDGPALKTPFENFLSILLNIESKSNSKDDFHRHPIWNNPLITHTNDPITEPLTSLPNSSLKIEAIKLFKSVQLIVSVPIDFSAIDYHVTLIQNCLQVCFDYPRLQSELFYQLIKQSNTESDHKHQSSGMFDCSANSLFKCDNSALKSSTTSSDSSINDSVARKLATISLQCFQFLAITISIFIPKNQVLWLLKHHIDRCKDPNSELGKYAFYCERALNRVLINGPRKQIPSRMEALSIIQRNPFQHSLPHSIPVHFANSSYLVIGFDGSSTIAEFVHSINAESGIRDNVYSGFALFSDDPINENVEHLLNLNCKLADIISHWESNLRKYHLGKFENTKVIKLIYRHRLCLRKFYKNETDRERLLWVYEINRSIMNGHFPITLDLAIELVTLIIQIECGDYANYNTGDQIYDKAIVQFFPAKFQDTDSLKEKILKRWSEFNGRSTLDCVRIYLNCARKWFLCGSKVFEAKVSNLFKYDDLTSLYLCKIFSKYAFIWLAVSDDFLELLETESFRPILRIPYKSIINFGGYKSHFMLLVNGNMLEKFVPETDSIIPFTEAKSIRGQRLFFAMSKKRIVEITMLLADYININTYNLSNTPVPATVR